MKRAVLGATACLMLLAFLTALLVTGGPGNENLWSIERTLRGVPRSATAEIEADRVLAAIRSDDAAGLARLCPQPLADLHRWVGQPAVSARLVEIGIGEDLTYANVFVDVRTRDSTSSVFFSLEHGPVTGWRTQSFEITP